MFYIINCAPKENILYKLRDLDLQEGDTVLFSYPNGLMSYVKYTDGGMTEHREDGPACFNTIGPITTIENGLIIETDYAEWWIDGECITYLVEDAMNSGKLNPDWRNWTKSDKSNFKLMFC